MSEGALLIPEQGELLSHIFQFVFASTLEMNKFEIFFSFRPATTIAAAIGGVLLVIILLALLVFYLRRQRKLKRKETLRRILQEHEVGAQGHHK